VSDRGVGDAAYLLVYSWAWDNVCTARRPRPGAGCLGNVDRELTEFHDVRKPWIGCV
jgi:hypothetical protein